MDLPTELWERLFRMLYWHRLQRRVATRLLLHHELTFTVSRADPCVGGQILQRSLTYLFRWMSWGRQSLPLNDSLFAWGRIPAGFSSTACMGHVSLQKFQMCSMLLIRNARLAYLVYKHVASNAALDYHCRDRDWVTHQLRHRETVATCTKCLQYITFSYFLFA